jgi:hypothetical protein
MIETEDCDLLDCTDVDPEDEAKPGHGALLWPWLVLLSLLVIGVSALSALVVG